MNSKNAEYHFEMSRYIDLELYHSVERSHPYYEEMIQEMLKQLEKHCTEKRTYKVLELGAGTGILTLELLKHPKLEITALDVDEKCCAVLKEHLKSKRCKVVLADAAQYCEENKFDVVISSFAHDHIHYDKRFIFAKKIMENLKLGGVYIVGDEILGDYKTPKQRHQALLAYHCHIVDKSLREGKYRLAQIEINALESGVDMVGDFKRHEKMFEEEMVSAGMKKAFKKKMGPIRITKIGGVFVYVWEKG